MSTHCMLYTTIFSFGILPDGDEVHIIIWRLKTIYRLTWPNICVEIKFPARFNNDAIILNTTNHY